MFVNFYGLFLYTAGIYFGYPEVSTYSLLDMNPAALSKSKVRLPTNINSRFKSREFENAINSPNFIGEIAKIHRASSNLPDAG